MIMYDKVIRATKEVGFPIVCVGILFWMVNTTVAKQSESIDSFKDVVVELNHSVDNNTKAIESLTDETTSIKDYINNLN